MAKIQVFSAGCPICESAEQLVREVACPECTVEMVPINTPAGNALAAGYGITRAPAVVVDGVLAACCQGAVPDREVLKAAIAA